MNIRKLLVGSVICCLALIMPLAAQEGAGEGEGAPDMEAKMAEYAKYHTPGEHHKHMQEMIGDWDVVGKFWMGPGEPMMSTGTAKFTSLYGGLYVKQEYKSAMMGMPLEGTGLMGYDLFNDQHWAIWYDNMSSGIYKSTGTCDAEDMVMTSTGMMDDPMTGRKDVKVKETVKTIDDDTFVFTMYEVGEDGTETKTMEMTYTRKK